MKVTKLELLPKGKKKIWFQGKVCCFSGSLQLSISSVSGRRWWQALDTWFRNQGSHL